MRKILRVAGLMILLVLILTLGLCSSAFSTTKSGTTIESFAEMYYGITIITSEVSAVEVLRIYGLTLTPTDSAGSITPEGTCYFPHEVKNVGNNSDQLTFSLSGVTPEGWSAQLLKDDNMNGFHEETETTPVPTNVILAEDAIYYFFLALTAPVTIEGQGSATVTITSEGEDGGPFYGANGILYGGDDLVSATDTATVTTAALSNLCISRDDATGDITLTWEGLAADVHYIEGTYEADFSGSSVEAYNVTSPWTSEVISAQDGNIRYYRIAAAGTSNYTTEHVGKFDINTYDEFDLTSIPFVISPESANDIDVVLGFQLTAGNTPFNSDLCYNYADGSWTQAFLNVDYGWLGSLEKYETDKGYWIKILVGHPDKIVTFVGEVSSAPSREVDLVQDYNLVGNAYPVPVDINSSGLDLVLTAGTSPFNSDRIYAYTNTGTSEAWEQSFLRSGVGWVGTVQTLDPGRGYWIFKQASGTVTWYYPKPY